MLACLLHAAMDENLEMQFSQVMMRIVIMMMMPIPIHNLRMT